MPALPPYLIEPIWQQFAALLPEREVNHPLGCHRPRIPDRVVFEKLVPSLGVRLRLPQDRRGVLLGYPTLRERGEEWIELGVIDALREAVLKAYNRFSSAWTFLRWAWTVLHNQSPLRRRESGQQPGG